MPGSAALLRALSRRDQARVVILSGSPTQMREVLSEKLRLDGVRYDELHLKDNLGNLRRGRFRAIRGQFGYKLPVLLRGRVGLGSAVRECCFGDDAEVDALVYSVFADVVAGRIRPMDLSRIMEAAGAYPERVREAVSLVDRLATGEVVDRIFIHLDRGVPVSRFDPLGGRVVPVFSWFQAALVLHHDGQLNAAGVLEVARESVETGRMTPLSLANHLQDLLRRGAFTHADLDTLRDQLDDPGREALAICFRRAALISDRPRPRPPRVPLRVDYLRLLKAFGRKESRR